MERLSIKGTDSTPEISFDPLKGVFIIEGRSFSENAADFFHPIVLWLEKYAEIPLEETHLSINMDLINTTSIKFLLSLFAILEEMKRKGKSIKVTWWYHEDDDETKEIGESLNSMTDLKFEYETS